MDLPRRRRPDQPSDLARRRLELLGAQLGRTAAQGKPADDGRPPPPVLTPWGPPSEDRGAHEPAPAPVPVPLPAAGRHRAGSEALRRALVGELAVRRPHVVVVLLVVALTLAATGWWVSASRPQEVRPLGSAEPGGADVLGQPAATDGPESAAGTPTPTPTGAPTAATSVVVDVTGKVARPGIVTLPAGSRVADAVESAGGAKPGADLSTVNLARVLVDGEQVVVGLPPVDGVPGPASAPATGAPSAGAPPGAADPSGLVDLNTATMEQLDTLPGVGPVTAQAILDHRTEIGRFTDVEELLDVRGIGDARLADLRERVVVR